MIINVNGTLRVKLNSSSEEKLDDNGYPAFSSDSWSEPIECNIKTNSRADVGATTNGNVFETSDFEVLIEQQSFSAEIINLVRDGVDLGEFQIQGEPEPLDVVGNIKIIAKCLSNV